MVPQTALTIDGPEQDATVRGAVRTRGWAIAEGRPALPRVEHPSGGGSSCLWPIARVDVAEHFGLPAHMLWGFEGLIDLEERSGPVTIVFVLDTAEGTVREERVIDAVPSGIRLGVDEPSVIPVVQDVIEVRGWAEGPGAAAVSVFAEGPNLRQPLVYGQARHAMSGPDAPGPVSGFEGHVAAPGPRALGLSWFAVVAESADGGLRARGCVAERAVTGRPAIGIDRLMEAGDIVTVSASVAWPRPVPIAPVAEVVLDGRVLARGPADRARPDMPRRLPGHACTARCGALLRFPHPGVAAVTLRVRTGDGRVVERELALPERRRSAPVLAATAPGPGALTAAGVEAGSCVLDWGAGLLAGDDPVTLFTPIDAGSSLPYLESSIDYVAVPEAIPGRRDEARRIAARAVLVVRRDGGPLTRDDVGERPGSAGRPSVSVVIPVHGQDAVTDACLRAVLAERRTDLEVVVVDDASPEPATRALIDRWARADSRLRPVLLDDNVGYLHAVNAGAAASTGEHLVLLNSDTAPQPGWLDRLQEVVERRPRAGVVGARLVYPDGSLQEAGGVVFCDGSAANLGRGHPDPDAPAFCFVRSVDYCSAAALLTPRSVWDRIGGFDERFAPAYYEDTDYCMAVRDAGLEVLVQPAATVIHHEGASHGTDVARGVKAGQAVNRDTFAEKWPAQLAARPARPDLGTPIGRREASMAGRGR